MNYALSSNILLRHPLKSKSDGVKGEVTLGTRYHEIEALELMLRENYLLQHG